MFQFEEIVNDKVKRGDSFRRKNTWSPLLCGDYNLNFSHVFPKRFQKVSKLSESLSKLKV